MLHINRATSLLFNLVLSRHSAQVSGMEETDSSMEGISGAFRGTSLQGLGPKKKLWVLLFHLSIVLWYFFKIPDGPVNQPWASLWPYDPCILPYTFAVARQTPMDGFWRRRRPYSRVCTSLTALLLRTPPSSFYPVSITTGNSVNTASSNHFSQLSQALWIASQTSKPQNKIFGT